MLSQLEYDFNNEPPNKQQQNIMNKQTTTKTEVSSDPALRALQSLGACQKMLTKSTTEDSGSILRVGGLETLQESPSIWLVLHCWNKKIKSDFCWQFCLGLVDR